MAPAYLKRWRDRVRAHHSELVYSRLLALVCVLWALVASVGWHSASQSVRVFIPPQLPYGGTFSAGEHQPWQVFSFAGYIWQQYGSWPKAGERDAAANLNRLGAFFTPQQRARLAQELTDKERRGETAGRVRTLRPLGLYRPDLVQTGPGSGWIVHLDMQIEESLHGIKVRSGAFRYSLEVISADLDPERNPWGLLIANRVSVSKLPAPTA